MIAMDNSNQTPLRLLAKTTERYYPETQKNPKRRCPAQSKETHGHSSQHKKKTTQRRCQPQQ